MWKYYIEVFRNDNHGWFVEDSEKEDGLPLCCDFTVAKSFNSTDELNAWVDTNTTLTKETGEYGIRGIFDY